jgi:hypothetical protein
MSIPMTKKGHELENLDGNSAFMKVEKQAANRK